MGRKRRQTETGIGSDSFLDIIANIVGILIILIVVAGVRIGQAPLPEPESTEDIEDDSNSLQKALPDYTEPTTFPTPDFIVGTTEAPQFDNLFKLPASSSAPPEPIVIERWKEHTQEEMTRHKQQLAQLQLLERQRTEIQNKPTASIPDTAADLRRLTEAQTLLKSLNTNLLRSKDEYDAKKAQLAQSAQLVASTQQHLEEMDRRIEAVEQQLSEAESTEANTDVLQHDATPVSQDVKSRELHFVVKNGKVAEVPIDALLEQVKEQIQRRRDWILRSNKHIGIAGPIRGFKMEYLVERQTLSTLDQLRVGGGIVRIGLSKWTIERDPDTLVEETLEQASSSTSRFLVSVRSAPIDASCTFWVYPDSFSEYQKLKQLVHESGQRVAGRPLPEGMPIGGSPQGSRSASQ